MDIEAVVVTHNSMDDLPGLLDCAPLRRAFARMTIVDNASTDGSAELASAASGVRAIACSENAGFGAAVNVGVRGTTSPFVCVLNPDIRLSDERALAQLAEHFADPAVAIVAPALILPDGSHQDSARAIPVPLDLVRRRVLHRDFGAVRLTQATSVAWVVGAFMLIRRDAFDRVGGFDERFRLYFEDVDLCVRLGRHGLRVLYDPTVSVSHEHKAASRQSLAAWSTRVHLRSALRFYAHHPRHIFTHAGGRDTALSSR
jgi:GT2 family glycosyltransferase